MFHYVLIPHQLITSCLISFAFVHNIISNNNIIVIICTDINYYYYITKNNTAALTTTISTIAFAHYRTTTKNLNTLESQNIENKIIIIIKLHYFYVGPLAKSGDLIIFVDQVWIKISMQNLYGPRILTHSNTLLHVI